VENKFEKMGSSKQMEHGRQKEDESIEISYTILRAVNQRNRDEILQKIVAAINVQLALENSQSIPFISSNGFDNVKLQDKLFIYGPSGCGKSRCIYELAKDKINDVENIFIINPRQTIGEESGRISIRELANGLSQKDIVIWDNFPDDLLKRDVESAWEVLEIISVKEVTKLLVALKPKYLEVYRGVIKKVPELYDYEISYDKQKISSIITSYGKKIIQFTYVYEKYVLPNIHQISTTLWQKEPLPITILAYFRELVRKQNETNRESIDAILEAEKLMHRTDYYKHQFALISNLEDRQNDIDFLYTLKLCYELSLSRAPTLIHQLQKGIFYSIPPEDSVYGSIYLDSITPCTMRQAKL
jgi:RNA helicase